VNGPHEVVNPASLAAPSGFNHAVISAGGQVVWLAGQTASDADGAIIGIGDVVAQYERAMQNLLTVLAAAGGRPEHLVSMTTYVVDLDGYRTRARELGQIWRGLVGDHYPAMAAIGVSRLWDPDALVEVQGVAVVTLTP